MPDSVVLRILRLRAGEDIDPPGYATPGSSGIDLPAAIDKDILLKPGARALVPTGIAMAVPPGYEAQVRPRSGLAFKHGVTVLNSPGTIDSDYRGEVKVILANFGDEPFTVHRGDRIAQLVIASVTRANVVVVSDLDGTERGPGGFGHTGS